MKLLLTLLILIYSITSVSQNEKCYNITYDSYSMTYKTYKKPLKNLVRLYVCDNKSLYQWEKVRKLDSIKNTRNITFDDVSKFRTKEKYAIEITGDSLKYYDVIANTEYRYTEKIDYNWKLHNDTKKINGYLTKKATTEYAGRNWVAWYAIDLPINAGPYKFKNLPGLVIEMKDETDSYLFQLKSLKTSNSLPLKKSYYDSYSDEVELVKTTRVKYNKIRFKYNSMSLKERLNLINKVEGTTNELVMLNSDKENPFSNFRQTKASKKNNFIEIDHK